MTELLRCPACLGALRAEDAALACDACDERWPVRDGLPRLLREAEVRGTDRLLRLFYDGLPRLHDPAVELLLPLLQLAGSRALREGYLPWLELAGLRPPLRILEVGIGTGANLPLLARDLPRGDVEVWGVDLSEGMLGRCRRRLARAASSWPFTVRLALADAHALPFADASFDRVFHVGAAGSFRDPRRALAELARVAKPGTPIVVVDEQLEPTRRHGPWRRAAFRLLTFYDRHPHCPRELLPPNAIDVAETQVSPFYYCLRFRT